MSSKQSQEDKQFDQFKANFFKCITDVLQLFVENLYPTGIKNFKKDVIKVFGPVVHHRMFMDIQHPIVHAGDISKMNIASCYSVLQYVFTAHSPPSKLWTDTGTCGNSLEKLSISVVCQLIGVAYSKDYFDNIQQNDKWNKLIETLNEMYGIVLEDFHNTDFEFKLSALIQCWSIREEMKEEIDLSECMTALDFIVRSLIFKSRKHLLSFMYFCPKKLFSKFKISHLNTDELISYTDIFDWKDKDDQFPQIYVICGQRAVGKSLYMKYLYQQCESDSSFIGIGKFEHIIFIESSNNSAYCLEYIHSALPNIIQACKLTNSEIQEIILRGKLLVMMDSFDVATPETHQLLNEITTFNTDITLMIATRSDCLDDLCEKLPKTKKTIILYPEKNVSASVCNKSQGQISGNEGVTASCAVSLGIPPGYEASTVSYSKVLLYVNQMENFSNIEKMVTIDNEKRKDKKKPSVRTIKNAASKLNILIEHLHTATAQLSKYESDEERCQLQEIIIEYEELYKEADVLNKALPPGMRSVLYNSFESIFFGIPYWFEQLCGPLGISRKMLTEMDENYSEVKNYLNPKPLLNFSADCERPTNDLVFASIRTLTELREKARKAVTMIENNDGRTDEETKYELRVLVIDIRNFRERCDSFNASIPKIDMLNFLEETKNIGLFAGLDYWQRIDLKAFNGGKTLKINNRLVPELDELDKKIRNHLLSPEPIQPKLVKSWKTEVISSNKKKVKKTKVKKKCKTGW